MKINTSNIRFYNGIIHHKRKGAIQHFFENNINAISIDLKNNKNSNKYPILFSINQFNFISWYPSNHGEQLKNSSNHDLIQFILRLINQDYETKSKIENINLLTFPRVFGYGFNPLSIYFCYDKRGSLLHSVFEVKNTFGDIHHYVLRNIHENNKTQKLIKKLFVSPFYPSKGYYHLYANQLIDNISVSIEYIINEKNVFSASMNLKEIKFNNFNILKSLIKLSLFPGKIWINIHLQAFYLWLKKIRFYKVPIGQKIKYSFGSKILKDKKLRFNKK